MTCERSTTASPTTATTRSTMMADRGEAPAIVGQSPDVTTRPTARHRRRIMDGSIFRGRAILGRPVRSRYSRAVPLGIVVSSVLAIACGTLLGLQDDEPPPPPPDSSTDAEEPSSDGGGTSVEGSATGDASCASAGQTCRTFADCCLIATHPLVCGAEATCHACGVTGGICSGPGTCCNDAAVCDNSQCCLPRGAPCNPLLPGALRQCCDKLACDVVLKTCQ